MKGTRFLQTKFWTEFKTQHGWKVIYLYYDKLGNIYTKDENNYSKLSILVRNFSVKIKEFSLAYIPMAPNSEIDTISNNLNFTKQSKEYFSLIENISKNIKEYLPKNCICIRFDPPIDFNNEKMRNYFVKNTKFYTKARVKHSKVSIQPRDTNILSLTDSEDEILAKMKSKWRYNIRLASKKDVQIKSYVYSDEGFLEAFEEFYKLFKITSERDGVNFHNKEYYLSLLKKSCEDYSKDKSTPLVKLYVAKHESDYIAGIITLFCDFEAVYLYGASGNLKRNLMPAYLLQWTAICDAKKYNCPVYDFYGMPPNNDKNHPMHGLYLFKTGFGGQNVHRPGTYDYILNKPNYTLYILAEKIRAFYFKKIKKLFKK